MAGETYRMNPMTLEISNYQNSINAYADQLGYGTTPSAASVGMPAPDLSNVTRDADGIESITTLAKKWPWILALAGGALLLYVLLSKRR